MVLVLVLVVFVAAEVVDDVATPAAATASRVGAPRNAEAESTAAVEAAAARRAASRRVSRRRRAAGAEGAVVVGGRGRGGFVSFSPAFLTTPKCPDSAFEFFFDSQSAGRPFVLVGRFLYCF